MSNTGSAQIDRQDAKENAKDASRGFEFSERGDARRLL